MISGAFADLLWTHGVYLIWEHMDFRVCIHEWEGHQLRWIHVVSYCYLVDWDMIFTANATADILLIKETSIKHVWAFFGKLRPEGNVQHLLGCTHVRSIIAESDINIHSPAQKQWHQHCNVVWCDGVIDHQINIGLKAMIDPFSAFGDLKWGKHPCGSAIMVCKDDVALIV